MLDVPAEAEAAGVERRARHVAGPEPLGVHVPVPREHSLLQAVREERPVRELRVDVEHEHALGGEVRREAAERSRQVGGGQVVEHVVDGEDEVEASEPGERSQVGD